MVNIATMQAKEVNKSNTKKESNVDIVINKIKDLLLEGSLQPGDMLPAENDLAHDMNVSRSTIREGMKVLSAFGVIEIRRGDGTYISSSVNTQCFNPLLFSLLFQEGDKQMILDLREMVEVEVVKLIVRNAVPDDYKNLHEVLDNMEQDINEGTFDEGLIFKYELAFHQAMGTATHNPLVVHIYDFLMEFFRPQIKNASSKLITANGKNSLEIHKKILQAVEEKNPKKAERAIIASLKTWGKYFVI